jgi:hypothetical protein
MAMIRGLSHKAALILIAILPVSLSGCLLDRVQAVQEQACKFDENFSISADNGVSITFYNPVLRMQDVALLVGLEPAQEKVTDNYVRASYVIRKVGGTGELEIPINLGFTLQGYELLFSDAQIRSPHPLVKYALQTELVADNACHTALPRWSSLVEIPIPKFDRRLLPTRDQIVSFAGTPATLSMDGKALLYEFILQGADDNYLPGSLKLVYDKQGKNLLRTHTKLSRYESVADFETGKIVGKISL